MEQGETGEMTLLLHLFFEFFKVGLFAVGGGLATLPFLYALSAKTGWFTPADIADMIAVSESTPGAIGLNMATFAGYLTGGVPGAVIATVGLTVPSIIVILLIANLLDNFQEKPLVKHAFYGLRPASIALIAASGISVFAVTMLRLENYAAEGVTGAIAWKAVIYGAVLYAAQEKLKWSPIVFIFISAAVGVIFKMAS